MNSRPAAMIARRAVMISSTARDLPEHREQVRLACERAGFAPHDMMEHLTALNTDAVDISLQMVERADAYVGIFANRYGYIPDGYKISITEMEYDRAVELNKPRLIFFHHEDHVFKAKDFEAGPGAEKLKVLKDRIGEARVVAFFKSPEDLRAHVVEALTTLAKEFDVAAGGGATTAAVVAKLHRKSSIPTPPEPYIAHPYTLLQSRVLIGRQAELNALTDWVANPAAQSFEARVFCFIAIGGMGKSALTWKWFHQIAPNEMKPLAGRLWWSFYESDATFENFLIRALCYVSGESENAVRALPWPEREGWLLRQLNDQPYLFVLDGLERILIAYHRMDASYLADDKYDEQTANRVVGAIGLPASAAQSFVGQHRLRQTSDPRAGAFLQKLAGVVKSRILITSRLYPTELQLPTGRPRLGCFAHFLPGLSDDDALGLWRALNVAGSRAELVPIFRSVEGHPLLVQALASEVANYRRAPGDFAQWRAHHPRFDPTSLRVAQSRTHILTFALEGISDKASKASKASKVSKVLHTLVGFRMPASYATLEALLVGPDKPCGSAKDLDRALTELEDRGLIGWDREANRYDAHPIVRGVVWQSASVDNRRAVYTALEAHFEPMATPEWLQVESLSDLTPAIERYHTLIGLERYDDAFALFHDRLSTATLYRLAAHRERIAWLELLFPHGLSELPSLAQDGGKANVLSELAHSYRFSGQPSRAVPLYRRNLEIRTRQEKWDGTSLAALGQVLRETGALREGLSLMRSALTLTDMSTAPLRLAELGRALSTQGHPFGGVALYRARHIFTERGHHQGAGGTNAYLAERSIWLGDLKQARALADKAWELAAHERAERDFIRAAVLQGQVALGLGNLTQADERLHLALTRTRSVNVVELELPALIAIAALRFEQGRPTEARAGLDDVWEAAERGRYPLYQADAYNVLADIELAEGDKSAAITAAANAYRAAWCDGPPYSYHWGLEKAKARLAALGVPEPNMPPFDESKFEPMPEVDINPKDKYWIDPNSLD
jgi:tetratricopeptide (TPR) repeat protein